MSNIPRRFDLITLSAYYRSMKFSFDPEYNTRLYDARRVTFEDALEAISIGHLLFHFSYPAQSPGTDRRIFVVEIAGSRYFVPYIVNGDVWRLETIYPLKNSSATHDRSTTEMESSPEYLSEEVPEAPEKRKLGFFGIPGSGGTGACRETWIAIRSRQAMVNGHARGRRSSCRAAIIPAIRNIRD